MKLFTKKGIEDHGTLTLSFVPPEEHISDIEGTVYLPDGTTHKLEKKDIHRKKTSKEFGFKETEINIAFPGLAEGAIVEYSYRLSFEGLQSIYRYYFQTDLFCRKSEVRFYPWPQLPWGVSFANLQAEPEVDRSKLSNKQSVLVTRENIPPLRKEPYGLPVSSMRECAVFFHKDSQAIKKNYWMERGAYFYKTELKSMFKPRKNLDTALIMDPGQPDAIKRIYDYVCSKFISIDTASKQEQAELDKAYIEDLIEAKRLKQLLKFKFLLPAQMNYVLGAYLASYLPDVQIEYVQYLPWNEGFFNPNVHTLRQFRESMVKVTWKGGTYWLCPNKRFLPMNQVPFGAYGNKLYVVGPDKVEFQKLDVPSFEKNHTAITLDLSLNEEGSKAKITRKHVFDPFESYYYRSKYFYFETAELRDQIEEDLREEFGSQTELVDHKLENLDNVERPLVLSETFEIPVNLEEAGDYLLLKSVGLVSWTENPFNQETRTQNVIFPYPYRTTIEATYHFGEGFKLPQLPKGTRVNEAIFTYAQRFQKLDDHNLKIETEERLEQHFFRPQGGEFFKQSIDPMMKAGSQVILIEEVL